MKWLFILYLSVLVALWGCSSQVDAPQTSAPGELLAYQTRTPAPVIVATFPPTASPAPSPTPFIYSVARGDTLSVLAQRFGVSLDALLAANPGLAPEAMSVGQKLNIPTEGQDFRAARATPAALELGPARCLGSNGGLVCLAPVKNTLPESVENVRVQVTLFDQAGNPVGSQEASLPLNILGPGQVLPAAAFFPGVGGQVQAQALLLSATRLSATDARYLRAEVQNLLVKTAWDGLSVSLQGQVSLPPGARPATRLWLAAVAYDVDGQIVGYRRWEATQALQPGSALGFEMYVYSLGAVIERVDVQIEAAGEQPNP